MNPLKIEANGRWFDILSMFIEPKYLTGKHCPCPLCGGKDRFRWDNKDGSGSYICSQCGAGTGIHLLAQCQGIEYRQAWRIVEKTLGFTEKIDYKIINEDDKKNIIAKILKTITVERDEVDNYLRSRGIKEIPEFIYQGKYFLDKEPHTVMICKASKGNRLVGLHVTFLKDGVKVTRKMYSVAERSMVGSAVRLNKIGDSETLLIAEGIETALSARQITGIPAWAAMDAGKMESVEIPEHIKNVVIAGDIDETFTGQAAAYNLAKRLRLQNKFVEVIFPEKGNDFNDYIKHT